MKKLIAMLLAMVMMMSLVACGENTDGTTTVPTNPSNPTNPSEPTEPTEPTNPAIQLPASAQEMMQTIYDGWDFEYKAYMYGGGPTTPVDGAPGALNLTSTDDTDFLKYVLNVPEANVGDVVSASDLYGMNMNSFTAVALQVNDAAAFAAVMEQVLTTSQFTCGVPEQLLMYTLGNGYVLYAIGTADNMTLFSGAVTAAYPEVVEILNAPVA